MYWFVLAAGGLLLQLGLINASFCPDPLMVIWFFLCWYQCLSWFAYLSWKCFRIYLGIGLLVLVVLHSVGDYHHWLRGVGYFNSRQQHDVTVIVKAVKFESSSHISWVGTVIGANNVRLGDVLLSWYGRYPDLQLGELWRLSFRLAKTYGHLTDERLLLLRHNWLARGTVLSGDKYYTHRVAFAHSVFIRFNQRVYNLISDHIHPRRVSAIISALLLGDRRHFDRSIWNLFQRTGTTHLVALSGLHVVIIIFGALRVILYIINFCSPLSLYIRSAFMRLFLLLLLSIGYYCVVVQSVPIERALLMVVLVSLMQCLQQRLSFLSTLSLVLFLVVAIDSLAVLSVGFWLSFYAVFWIGYLQQSRYSISSSTLGAVYYHALLWLGLAPVTLYFFQQMSLVALLANFIAVPWLSWLVIPLLSLGMFLSLISSYAAVTCWKISAILLRPLLLYLGGLSSLSGAYWQHTLPGPVIFLLFVIVLLLLLLPRGVSGRWWGVILAVPLFFGWRTNVSAGSLRVKEFSSGSGIAIVLMASNGSKNLLLANLTTKQLTYRIIPQLHREGIRSFSVCRYIGPARDLRNKLFVGGIRCDSWGRAGHYDSGAASWSLDHWGLLLRYWSRHHWRLLLRSGRGGSYFLDPSLGLRHHSCIGVYRGLKNDKVLYNIKPEHAERSANVQNMSKTNALGKLYCFGDRGWFNLLPVLGVGVSKLADHWYNG